MDMSLRNQNKYRLSTEEIQNQLAFQGANKSQPGWNPVAHTTASESSPIASDSLAEPSVTSAFTYQKGIQYNS